MSYTIYEPTLTTCNELCVFLICLSLMAFIAASCCGIWERLNPE